MQHDLFTTLVAEDGEFASGLDLDDIPNVGGDNAVQDAVLHPRRVFMADFENLDTKGALGRVVVLEQREAIVVGVVVDTPALGSALGTVTIVGNLVKSVGVARL
jgi:hypothetical protein